MSSYTRRLVEFTAGSTHADLPREIADYTKLLILDTLVCAIAAGDLPRSQMMHAVVRGLGGPPESTVFGMKERVSSASATMANAEIMNCLDADDTFFTTSHFGAFNVAGALAEAQRNHATGQQMILATAIGFDINARLNLASQVIGEEEDGSLAWAPVQGMGFAAFGVAAAAGILRNLSTDQIENAFGLVNLMAPTPSVNQIPAKTQHDTMKYGNYAGPALAGILSASMAEQGYIAEPDCLDGDGFLRAQGCLSTDHELLVEELGLKWWIDESCLKLYPCCRYGHGPIDMLLDIMREQSLAPAEIQRIEIRLNPMGYALRLLREPSKQIAADHRAPLNGAFNIPYAMALAALGRPPGPDWYSTENLSDPQVWEFANKIGVVEDVSARDEVRLALKEKIRRFRRTPASITVWARGEEFPRACEYTRGDSWTAETRASWQSVTEKLSLFCSKRMSADQVQRLVEQVRSLDQMRDVAAELELPD
jgi:2-methylcitrate dehydratase PrpD